jgi:hypothetical protein
MRALTIFGGLLGIGLVACMQATDSEQPAVSETKVLPPSNIVAEAPEADNADDPALPAGFRSWKDVMAAQVPLLKAVRELEERLGTEPVARGVEPEGFPGFATIEIDVSKAQVSVYWKGEAPAKLTPLLKELEVRHHVRVATEVASFSRAELDRERLRVISEVGKEATITRIGPLPRGEGLLVEVEEPVADVERLAAFKTAASRLTATLGAAVKDEAHAPFVLKQGVVATPMARDADTSPYFGGARIKVGNATLTDCSSAFAAVDGSNNSYMLTAAHCTSGLHRPVWNGNQSRLMGDIFSIDPFIDSALVHVFFPASSFGVIYAGGVVPGIDERFRNVLTHTSNTPGMFVCTSGAFSGERCNIRVLAVNQDVNMGGRLVFPAVIAQRDDGQNAVGTGDSGGPVFVPIGPNHLFAAGTISGGVLTATPASCTGQVFPTRTCSFRLIYAPIFDVLQTQHVHLKTSP